MLSWPGPLVRHAEIQRLEWKDLRFDDGSIEIRASKAKTASRRMVPILPNLKEWLLKYRQPSGLVVTQRNASFELHLIAKRANQFRRAAWAMAHGITDEPLEQAEKQAREEAARRKAQSKLHSQKGEVPPGAETAEIEGWEPFAWKHNALRHSFISYRLAAVPNTAQVALEAGNSPQMIFGHYRELVRGMDAEKWFSITPEAVDVAKAAWQATRGEARESGGPIVVKKLLKGASSYDQAVWWWRDEDGVTRTGAADPVLGTAELTGLLLAAAAITGT